MFKFLENYLQGQNDNFMKHLALYIISGAIISAIYFISKDVRKKRIKKLAKELNLKYKPYGFEFPLFPALSFFIRRYTRFEPINIIEGSINGKNFLVFDFYYKNLSFIGDINGSKEQLITFINGEYFKNISTEDIKNNIPIIKDSRLEKISNKNKFLRFREIGIMDTYAKLNIKGNNIDLKIVERVLQKFRDVKYNSPLDGFKTMWISGNVEFPNKKELREIKKKVKKNKINLRESDVDLIIEEYVDNFKMSLTINK